MKTNNFIRPCVCGSSMLGLKEYKYSKGYTVLCVSCGNEGLIGDSKDTALAHWNLKEYKNN